MAAAVATKPRPANIDTGLATSTIQPGMLTARRVPRSTALASPPLTPTGFELSDNDTIETISAWNEEQVTRYVRSLGCEEYERLFKSHHINGENLLQLDKEALRDMGISKVGDRVRLSLSIKRLRSAASDNAEVIKREKSMSMATNAYRMSVVAPSFNVTSDFGSFSSSLPPVPDMPAEFKYQNDLPLRAMSQYPGSRPETPLTAHESNNETASDMDASMASGPAILTPAESMDGSSITPLPPRSTNLPLHSRNNPSISKSLMTVLPKGHDIIRVIATGGITKVIKVAGCTTCEQAMRITLRKFFIPEDHAGNYSFWALNSLDKLYGNSHRIGDTEFWHILQDKNRPERNRLILKRTGAGEPGDIELHRSAAIMIEEENHLKQAKMGGIDAKSMRKIQQLLGEKWQKLLGEAIPQSDPETESGPPPAARRPAALPLHHGPEHSHIDMITNLELLYPELAANAREERPTTSERLGSHRPASEAITQDLVSFFPNHDAEEIDRTARMSMSRSKRMSRINSRLSVASNFSFGSGINPYEEAPPVPTVPPSWLQDSNGHLAKIYSMDYKGTRIPTIYGGHSSYDDDILSPLHEQDAEYMSGSPQQRRLSDTALNDGTPIRTTFFQDQEYPVPYNGESSRNNGASQADNERMADDLIENNLSKFELSISRANDLAGETTSAQGVDLFSSSQVFNGTESEAGLSMDGLTPSYASRASRASEQIDYGSDGELIRGADASMITQMRNQVQALQKALMADGEEEDQDLHHFLSGESWDDKMWMKGTLIGKGSFGSVYLALHSVTGELMAVKQVENKDEEVDVADGRKRTMADALRHEIALLRDLKHPHIVQYLGCSTSGESMNIFLEYVAGGSVQSMLRSYGALPEPLIKSFVRQILIGLTFLHGRGIIHRDIKGGNILVDNKGIVKISDFGISKKLETSNILRGVAQARVRPSIQGSVFWMAPEVVKQTTYTSKADIWSLGCLVVEMMTGSHPYPDCSQLQAIFKIGGGRVMPTIPNFASGEAADFLAQTFEMDQDVRPAAHELLLCPFLKTDEEKEAERLEAEEKARLALKSKLTLTNGEAKHDDSTTVHSDGGSTLHGEGINEADENVVAEKMTEADETDATDDTDVTAVGSEEFEQPYQI